MNFGLYTLVIENHFRKTFSGGGFAFDFGWGNGYVLLPLNHPLYGVDYNVLNVNVHGGLTFGEKFEANNFPLWVRDSEIDGDVTMENCQQFDGYWMFGFDTSHYGDTLITCPKNYVMRDTKELLEQLLDDDIENMKRYKSIYYRKDRKDKLELINKMPQ